VWLFFLFFFIFPLFLFSVFSFQFSVFRFHFSFFIFILFYFFIQSHLVITKAKNSGSFVRYSEVSEEVPYSEVCLYGSRGVNFQKVHS